MSRIDHAARANNVLRSVASVSMASAEATVSVIAAQTHATLALVEQQRIANLIALFNIENAGLFTSAANRGLIEHFSEHGDWDYRIRPDIAAALGIEPKP